MVGVLKFFYFLVFFFLKFAAVPQFPEHFFFLLRLSQQKGIKACTCENNAPPHEYVGIRGINVVLPPRR